MPIKVVHFSGGFPYSVHEKNNLIALRMYGSDAHYIDLSFPFHEDTPNFKLTIPEALDLKNAIDQLIDLKMLEKPRGN